MNFNRQHIKAVYRLFNVSSIWVLIGFLYSVSLNAQYIKTNKEPILDNKLVKCMAQGPMGRLWFGTASGEIFIYSGNGIRKFNHTLSEPLQNITDIGFTSGGDLYGCSDKSFFFIDPQTNELSSRKLIHHIRDVLYVGNDVFLVCTSSGLYSINTAEKKMELVRGTSKKDILEIVGKDELFFIRTAESILKVVQGVKDWHTVKIDFPLVSPSDIFFDSSEALWIATRGKGVFKFKDDHWTKLDEFNGLLNDDVNGVFEYDNLVWVMYQNGVVDIITNGTGQAVQLQPGLELSEGSNSFLGVDQHSSMWIANSFGGLHRIYQTPFSEVRDERNNPLRDNILLNIKDDNLYGMASGNRFWRKDNGNIIELPLNNFGNYVISDFQVNSDGEIVMSTERGELLVVDPYNSIRLDSSSGIRSGVIDHLVCDVQDNIWFSQDGEVGILNPAEEIRRINLSKKTVKAIISDELEFVYVIQGKALFSFNDRRVIPFKQLNEIGEAFLFDINSSGLFMYDGQKLSQTSFDSSDHKVQIVADSVLQGAHSLHVSEKYAVLVGNFELQCIDLNLNRRKTIQDINGNSLHIRKQNSAMSQEGEMWLASKNAINRFWLKDIFKDEESINPRIVFADIKVSYHSICSDNETCREINNYEFPSYENDVSFSLEGIDFNLESEILYRWKMEGSGEEWTPYTPRDEISFTDLNPGNYRVWVMAKNKDNLESEILKSPLIVINPSWWQRPLVRWGSLGFLILLIAFTIASRFRQIRKKAEEEKEKLILEKKMLQYEQQALQLQLNPHFIFNALNNIQGRLSEADTKTARLQLSKFATFMRQILENSRRSWIPIKDELASLENYMKVEQYGRQEFFTWSLDWTDVIDLEEDMIPPMMIQPFVENAIIHGFRNIDYQGHIKVIFGKSANRIICRIEDNGIGLVKASDEKKNNKRSLATQVIKERLASLDTDFHQESVIIEEKKSKDGKTGVSVILKIPFKNQFS